MAGNIERYEIRIPEEALADLRRRLDATRLPETFASVGSDYGFDLERLPKMLRYWRDDFDWRAQERALNALPNFATTIEDQHMHFVHLRSNHEHAMPLLVSHGWPGSIVEFLKVFGPLTQPEAHGGDPADAFHVVAPSLPGFAFSGPTNAQGWSPQRMSEAFHQLMSRLGYARFAAQGGDWGALISTTLGARHPESVIGVHTQLPLGFPPNPDNPGEGLGKADLAALAGMEPYVQREMGYFNEQSTKPHTVGVALNDSPAGLAAWILEKFETWSDCNGDALRSFSMDELLTNISIYWLTGTATSSARIYYEFAATGGIEGVRERVEVPTGIARFPKELAGFRFPRLWVEQLYNVVHWSEPDRGGHFAAMEEPELWVDDVRKFFRGLR